MISEDQTAFGVLHLEMFRKFDEIAKKMEETYF